MSKIFNEKAESFFKINYNADVCYITRWVGDYHAPRLIALDDELCKIGEKLIVVQLDDKSSFYSHHQFRRNKLIKRLRFIMIKSHSNISLFINSLYSLYKLNPKKILVLGYNDPISLGALIYSKILFKKIYFMSDSKSDDQDRNRINEYLKSFLIKFFNGALVAGKRHKNYFESLGFNNPIEIPYDVIDNDYFRERGKQYLKHGSKILADRIGEKYILCVSRLVKRKRVDLALEIFFKSNVHKLGWNFVLVGDGPEVDHIISVVHKLGLTRNFIHFKNIPNHRMPAIYTGATALLLTSKYDQWGLCVNEAMACGVPVCISSRCGAANEIVKNDTGLVFSEDSIDKAINWLSKVCVDSNYHHFLSENCLKEIQEWGVKNYARSTVRLTLTKRKEGYFYE